MTIPLPLVPTSPDKLSAPSSQPPGGSPVWEKAVYNAVSQGVHGQSLDLLQINAAGKRKFKEEMVREGTGSESRGERSEGQLLLTSGSPCRSYPARGTGGRGGEDWPVRLRGGEGAGKKGVGGVRWTLRTRRDPGARAVHPAAAGGGRGAEGWLKGGLLRGPRAERAGRGRA